MAYLDATRTATLSHAHTQDVAGRIHNPFVPIDPDDQYVEYLTAFNFGGHLNFSLTISPTIVVTASTTPGAPWSWEMRVGVVITNGHGTSTTSYAVITSATETGATAYVDVVRTYSATYSASVSVDRLWDITPTAYSVLTAPTVFPPVTAYRWYERTTESATATAAIIITTTSPSSSTTITATGAATSRPTADYTAYLGADGYSLGPSTHTFTMSNVLVNGVAVHDIAQAHSWHGQTSTEWSHVLTGTVDGFGINTQSDGLIDTTSCLDRSLNIFGRIRAWDDAYNNSLSLVLTGLDAGSRTITVTTGSFGETDTFVDFSSTTTLTTYVDGSNVLTTASNTVPLSISAAITSASLTAVGDDAGATRVMMRGFLFDGWSIAHAASRSIAGTTNDRTYTPQESMSAYRYLQIQVQANSGTNQAGVIEITDYHGNTKGYNVVGATTTFAYVYIDLCSPDTWSVSALPTTDSKDSPYSRVNVTNSTFAGSESVDSAYWGVTSASRLRVLSGSITIGTTALVEEPTNGYTDSHYVPSGLGYDQEWQTQAYVSADDTTTTYYSRRFWQQDVDGRTEEESDVQWSKTVGGVTLVTSYATQLLSISDLATNINISDVSIPRHGGWTATNSVAYPGGCSVSQPALYSCFTNGVTGLAVWLHGGGILAQANGVSGTDFTYGFKTPDGTIKAQTLFDSINGDYPPDLYDPFNINGGTDGSLYLACGAILRGPAHGIVFDSAGDPATSGTVTLQLSSDSSSRGTDTAFDPLGNYQTGMPYGFGTKNHSALISALSVGINPLYTSKRQKAVFVSSVQAGGCLSSDVSPAQLATYAVVTAAGGVDLYHSRAHNGTNWELVSTPITGAECVYIRYVRVDGVMTLIIMVDSTAGNVDRYSTANEGNTVTVATTIGAGSQAAVCVSPAGMEYIFFRTSSANANRVKRDPMGNIVTASSAVVTGSVADSTLTCYWRLGVIYLLYTHTTNGVTIVSSSDDGETFS